MVKALSFVGLIFFALVAANWAFAQVSILIPAIPAQAQEVQAVAVAAAPLAVVATATTSVLTTIPNVPFLSQFNDIQSIAWQQVGCGITSLAMMINFYKPGAVSVNTLLQQGIAAGAYDYNDGWTFDGLIKLSKKYGLTGSYHDLSTLTAQGALARFQTLLKSGPVILSVHNKFNPSNMLPHLVVIDGIKNGVVYYNDPAAKTGKKKISLTNLVKGWEEKVIVLRPVKKDAAQISMAVTSPNL